MAVAPSSSTDISPTPVSAPPVERVRAVDPEFEARWDDWRARGRRHDIAVRRRMRAVGAMVVLGAVVVAVAALMSKGAF